MNRWCCLTISSSAAPFSFCLLSWHWSNIYILLIHTIMISLTYLSFIKCLNVTNLLSSSQWRRKHQGILCLHRWEVWPLKTVRSQWRHTCTLCRSRNVYIRQQQGASLVLSGGESICQCRGYRFDPWSGRIPHAMEQLSPCTTTIESML